MRARRLLAVAAAAQAFPELRDPASDLAHLARQALDFQTFGGGAGDERAPRAAEPDHDAAPAARRVA